MAENSEMEMAASGSRVLVVDDERAVADSLGAIFRMHGYEARATYSAEDALQIAVGWQPDLAVLDVMLPGMTGIELAVLLKQNHPTCQTLLFSGSARTGPLLEEAEKDGHSFEILAKPVHPQHLLDMVKTLLAAAVVSRSLKRLN